MKVTGWLILVALNFWLLFFYTRNIERQILIRRFIWAIPVIIVVSIAVALIIRLCGFTLNYDAGNAFIAAVLSLIIIAMINLFNQLFHFMIDSVVGFHQKNNAVNLNRQPIKFFVSNQAILKRAATVIWFLGSALMLYGVWLGPK